MSSELRELWRFRELLRTMVERDLKIRYKNSALGFLWSLLNPLVTVLVMSFVLRNFMYRDTPSISMYILAAYIPFVFLQLAIMDSAQTVLGAMALIKKIYFPREILPIASVISNFIHLLLALAVLFGYQLAGWVIWRGNFPVPWTVVFLPLLLIFTFCLALGTAFIVSALNTFYEDVKYIVGVLLYLLFFMTPVMYFSEMVANSELNRQSNGLVYKLYHLNPAASLINAYRKILVQPPSDISTGSGALSAFPLSWKYLAYTGVFSVGLLIFGYSLFNRLKWRFVERP